jgi:hypothetical protein
VRWSSIFSAGSAASWAACLALALSGCSTTAVKVWNLEQLHDGESHHRYQADLQSDTGWFWRRGVLGLFQGAGAQFAAQTSTEKIEDPAGKCLENLLELQERSRGGSEPDPRHIEWFARLAVEDPSSLSRERAVLALAEFGALLPVGLPARLGADQVPAGPDVLAPVLEELVRSVRGVVEGAPDAEAQVAKSCAAVRALDLDLAAGRRALRASAELERAVEHVDKYSTDLDALVRHIESLLVRRALAVAVTDKSEIVRAAAIHGIAATGGPRAFDAVLYERLRQENATRPLRSLMEVVAQYGLPVPEPGGRPLTHSQEEWIASIEALAVQHPEGEMRVRAMRTLQAVAAPELKSLREEDWYRWWLARKESTSRAGQVP